MRHSLKLYAAVVEGERIITTLLAVAALPASASCPIFQPDDRLVQRLDLPAGGRTLSASSYVHPGLGPGGIEAIGLLIYSPRCALLFEQEFEGASEIKLINMKLGGTPILVATTLSAGGSGCGLRHVMWAYEDRLRALAPAGLSHDNMGGYSSAN